MNSDPGQSNGPGASQAGHGGGMSEHANGPALLHQQATLNLHVYDYLVRYGYSKAAQGLEQDVPELSHRPALPLPSNFVLDSWQAYWDNQQNQRRKQAGALHPQYLEQQRMARAGHSPLNPSTGLPAGVLGPPGSQFPSTMSYGMHSQMASGGQGQMGYHSAGGVQPPLPMRPGVGQAYPMNSASNQQVYGGGVSGQFQVPESKASYGSLPKAPTGAYSLAPQSPSGIFATPQSTSGGQGPVSMQQNLRAYPTMPSPGGGQMYPVSMMGGNAGPGGQMNAAGQMVGPNGQMSMGQMMGPNGQMMGPNGQMMGPNGQMMGPGGQMSSNMGANMNPSNMNASNMNPGNMNSANMNASNMNSANMNANLGQAPLPSTPFSPTPQTPSSAPQTPVEPPSPSGAGNATASGTAAATGASATAKRAGKAGEKAKSTGTKRTSAKAKETAAVAASKTPQHVGGKNTNATNATSTTTPQNPTSSPSVGQPPLSLPHLMSNASPMGAMRSSMTPPPMGANTDPNAASLWHMQYSAQGAGAGHPGQPRWLTPNATANGPASNPGQANQQHMQPLTPGTPGNNVPASMNPSAAMNPSPGAPSGHSQGLKLNASAPNIGHMPPHMQHNMMQQSAQQHRGAHPGHPGQVGGPHGGMYPQQMGGHLQYPLSASMGAIGHGMPHNMSSMHLQQNPNAMGGGVNPGMHNPGNNQSSHMHGGPMGHGMASPPMHQHPHAQAHHGANTPGGLQHQAGMNLHGAPSSALLTATASGTHHSLHAPPHLNQALRRASPPVGAMDYSNYGRSDSGSGLDMSDPMFADSLDGHANSVSGSAFADGDENDQNSFGYGSGASSNFFGGPGSGSNSMGGLNDPSEVKTMPTRELTSGNGSGLDSSLESDYDSLNPNRKRKHPGYEHGNDFGDLNSPRMPHMPYNHLGAPTGSGNMVSSSIMGLHSQYGMGPGMMNHHGQMEVGSMIKSENGTSGPPGARMADPGANASYYPEGMMSNVNGEYGGPGGGGMGVNSSGSGSSASSGSGTSTFINSMMDVSGEGGANEMTNSGGSGAAESGKVTDLMGEAEEDGEEQPLLPSYQLEEFQVFKDHTSKVLVCAFDSTGKFLATGGGGTDAPIRVWDVVEGKLHVVLKGHTHNVTGLKWSSNPSTPYLLLSCSLDCTIRLWDVSNLETPEMHCVKHTQPLNALDWHPTCPERFLCTDHMEQLVLWYMKDATHMEEAPSKQLEGIANKQVRFSPNGRFIATGLSSSSVSTLKILDGETNQLLHELSGHDRQIIGLHWIDDSLIVSTSEDAVKIWKIAASTAECIQQFSAPGDKTYYAIPHPKCPTRILIGAYQKVYDWDYYSTKRRGYPCHEGIISCLSFSKANDMLATTSHDKLVKLWKLTS